LFLGFVGVMYLKMDVVGVAVVGLCLALLAVQKLTFEEEEDL
ncbi:TPA: PTS sugar transporter subunit IIC, partial [Enterococcus faecium]|nr:PTS sugar transporter subunit IIC [Enterococcus faecium]